jgi:uncharacterized protein YkwD
MKTSVVLIGILAWGPSLVLATVAGTLAAQGTASDPYQAVRDITPAGYKGVKLHKFKRTKGFKRRIATANIATTADTARMNAACFFATNVARLAAGKKKLGYSKALEQVAQQYARRVQHHYAHENPHGVMVALSTDDKTVLKAFASGDARGLGACRAIVAPDALPAGASGCRVQDRAFISGITNPYTTENLERHSVLDHPRNTRMYTFARKEGFFRDTNGKHRIKNHTYGGLASAVVDHWLHSPAHRRNLLDNDAVQVGCGSAFVLDNVKQPLVYVVQVLQLYEPVKARQN